MSEVYDHWHVRVGGESYGPYAHALMTRFVAEGRVTATTAISAAPEHGWFEAQRYAQFAEWQAQARASVSAERSTGRAAGAGPVTRHLVMAELRGARAMDFLRVMQSYLQCTRIGDTVWLVDGAGDTGALTHALSLTLTSSDRLFVADITDRPTGQHGFVQDVRSA